MFCPRELKGEGEVRTPFRSQGCPPQPEGVGAFLGGGRAAPCRVSPRREGKPCLLPKPGQQLRPRRSGLRISAASLRVLPLAGRGRGAGRRQPGRGAARQRGSSSSRPSSTPRWGGLSFWLSPRRTLPSCQPAAPPLAPRREGAEGKRAILFEKPAIRESPRGEKSYMCWIKLRTIF